MIPLVDTHCHVLAGLDDGARDDDEALRMCEMAVRDGIQVIAATAHQSAKYPGNTPSAILLATQRLAKLLAAEGIPLSLFPCGEVALSDTIVDDWSDGRLQAIGEGQYNVLVEYPNGYPGDFLQVAQRLISAGMRPVVAHAERYSQLLDNPEIVANLARNGCLIQVSVAALDHESSGRVQRVVKGWVRTGAVHIVGSDAHDSFKRRPLMASAYATIAHWADESAADRICGWQPLALLRGKRLRATRPTPVSRWRGFFQRWLGGRRTVRFAVPNYSKAKQH